MSKQGKFIVLEGTDGSGKTTQFDLLKKRFTKEKVKFKTADFPRYYESIWGQMVGEYLRGKYGELSRLDPHLSTLPYMIDQYTWSREVGKKWIENGMHILSNRYFTSNVHQISKLKTRARKNFRDWLWPAGYKHLGLLKPDIVIMLDVNPKIAKLLRKSRHGRTYLKGRKEDLAERDWKHQEAFHREYLYMVDNNHYWVKVSCVKNNALDLPEVIHERVWALVKRKIDNKLMQIDKSNVR